MLSIDNDDGTLIASVGAAVTLSPGDVRRALDAVGMELTTWLRSLTGEMRPPAGARVVVSSSGASYTYIPPRARGEGDRQAHPGHWADVTGQLALGYAHEVMGGGAAVWVLEISNSAEYAEALENRDAYWVLEGVFSTPAGEDAMRRYLEPLLSGGAP